MPSISMFYGITIMMYFLDNKEHKYPHIHIKYQDYEAVLDINEGEIIEGFLPKSKLRLSQAWVELHRDELLENWNLAVNGYNPKPIEPLK